MTSMMILGAIIMLLIGIVFGFIASGTGAKIAEPAPAPKRKSAAKKAPAKRKTAAKQKDDLKKISGVGPAIEKKLHKMGVTRYRQIANWKAADINKADDALNFKGRIKRENWVRQAKTLASGGETEFSKRQK
jgi:predicted flap endonuclease-1-like 5' DNA nuclease